jgi:hypothetical protein
MTRSLRALPILLLALALAACTATADESPSAPPTSSPSTSAEPSETADATPSAEPTESAEATPTPSLIEGEGGFTYRTHAEADALMEETFSCQNLDDGYEVQFPAEWNTNAEYGDVPQCSWFAPTEYETPGSGEVPDEVAITIIVVDGGPTFLDGEPSERSEGLIGATQAAYRVLVTGGGETGYYYVVQLGESFESGPNLVASTTTEMGGDFDLNRAVLDRMMATIEFIGVIQ